MAISWQNFNGVSFPTFSQEDLAFTPGGYSQAWGGGDNGYSNEWSGPSWKLNGAPDWFQNPSNVMYRGAAESTPITYGDYYDGPARPAPSPGQYGDFQGLQIKSADKQGTYVPYSLVNGQWTPDFARAQLNSWDTNNRDNWKGIAIAAAPLAAWAGATMMGGEAALAGAGGAAEAGAAGAGGWVSGADLAMGSIGGLESAAATAPGWVNGFDLAGGLSGIGDAAGTTIGAWGSGAAPALGADAGFLAELGLPPDALSTPLSGTSLSNADIAAQIGQGGNWFSNAGDVFKNMSRFTNLTGKGDNMNGTGALLGGLAGYLDAKNQPNSLTVTQNIDPRLAAVAYGADGKGGVAGMMQQLLAQQGTGLNPFQQQAGTMAGGAANAMTQAGQQISALGQQQPADFASLLDTYKGKFDANPFITQQQQAITDLATRNLKENVLPGIGQEAQMAGGYGGSRQGIAEGLAMSRLNQDLAPALTSLASNAWESSNNRALQGASLAGSYGLNATNQQANLLGTGAGLQWQGAGNLWDFGTKQQQAPWQSITNGANVLRTLPGNSSTTQPLFNNPWSSAMGGAMAGGNMNWGNVASGVGDLFSGIGKAWDWGKGFFGG